MDIYTYKFITGSAWIGLMLLFLAHFAADLHTISSKSGKRFFPKPLIYSCYILLAFFIVIGFIGTIRAEDAMIAHFEKGGRLVCGNETVISKALGWEKSGDYLLRGDMAIKYYKCEAVRDAE